LRALENRVLMRICGHMREKWREDGEDWTTRSFITCRLRQILCVGHVARMGPMRSIYKTLVWKLKGRDHLEDLGVDGRIMLEWILNKYIGRMWTRFIWLRIEASARFLWIWFCKRRRISWRAEWLLASQEGLHGVGFSNFVESFTRKIKCLVSKRKEERD
jgi:hypothetical protein